MVWDDVESLVLTPVAVDLLAYNQCNMAENEQMLTNGHRKHTVFLLMVEKNWLLLSVKQEYKAGRGGIINCFIHFLHRILLFLNTYLQAVNFPSLAI